MSSCLTAVSGLFGFLDVSVCLTSCSSLTSAVRPPSVMKGQLANRSYTLHLLIKRESDQLPPVVSIRSCSTLNATFVIEIHDSMLPFPVTLNKVKKVHPPN